MIRTLILSDLHGNIEALQKVLDHAYDHFAPTEVWCLGDTVGYGPDPVSVWRTLRNEPVPKGGWLAGNHDWGLVGKLNLGGHFQVNGSGALLGIQNFREEAWQVLLHQQVTLESQETLRQHLQRLPVMSQIRPGMYLAHGAFMPSIERAITHYLVTKNMTAPLIPPEKMVKNFQQAILSGTEYIHTHDKKASPQLFAFGHNHIPGLWRWQKDQWLPLDLGKVHPLKDLTTSPICINPGSVGFPRNGLGCPSYVLIDWTGQYLHRDVPSIALQYVSYDASITRAKMSDLPYVTLLQEERFLPDPKCS